jgi:methylthioribose-1-phosphate isomerase
MVRGRNIETGNLDTVRITPEGVGSGSEVWQGVYNPSFDVTPAELISESLSFGDRCSWRRELTSGCVVTEKGVAERKEGAGEIDVASVC